MTVDGPCVNTVTLTLGATHVLLSVYEGYKGISLQLFMLVHFLDGRKLAPP